MLFELYIVPILCFVAGYFFYGSIKELIDAIQQNKLWQSLLKLTKVILTGVTFVVSVYLWATALGIAYTLETLSF